MTEGARDTKGKRLEKDLGQDLHARKLLKLQSFASCSKFKNAPTVFFFFSWVIFPLKCTFVFMLIGGLQKKKKHD